IFINTNFCTITQVLFYKILVKTKITIVRSKTKHIAITIFIYQKHFVFGKLCTINIYILPHIKNNFFYIIIHLSKQPQFLMVLTFNPSKTEHKKKPLKSDPYNSIPCSLTNFLLAFLFSFSLTSFTYSLSISLICKYSKFNGKLPFAI